MPKTAAAVLGFALVTGSIGLNTARYPVVWRMVGPADQAAPVGEAIPSAIPPESMPQERRLPAALEKPSAPPTTVASAEIKSVSPASDAPAPPETTANDATKAAEAASPSAAETPSTSTSPPVPELPATKPPEANTPEIKAPAAEPPATKTAAVEAPVLAPAMSETPKTEVTKTETPAAEDPPKPLVPVVSAMATKDMVGNTATGAEIRRLPPVERGSSNQEDADISRLFAGTVPNYSATSTP